MRIVIYHCHLFKNAGSSLDWSLRRCFGQNFFENRKHFYSIIKWNEFLSDYIKAHEKIIGLTSHICSLVPPKVENVSLFSLALYRHPIERITSVASYEKKQGYKNSLGTISEKHVTLSEYVSAYLSKGKPASIRNMHTLRFAGRDNGTPVTDTDYQKALATLKNIPTIGLVRRYDESMVLFEESLRPYFPDLDLAYIPQNINQPPATIEQRLLQLRDELGDELYEQLCRANEYDLRLYVKTCELFEERIARIDHFESKLAEFRKRCQALAREQQP